MSRFISDQNQVGFFYESGTYANTSGALQWIGMVQTCEPDENINVMPIRFVAGTTRNVEEFVAGPVDNTGKISFYPQDWKFLAFALGSNVDAGSPTYTHTMVEMNSNDLSPLASGTLNPFPSFGLEVGQRAAGTGKNFVRTIKGAIVNSFTINMSQSQIVSCDLDYVAQSTLFSSGALTALTAATTRPFLWKDVRLHLPSGTTINELKNATLTVNNNLQPDHYMNGSAEIAIATPLNRDYSLNITVDATDTWAKALYDQYFIGGSTFNSLLIISASTGSRDVTLTLSGCKVLDMTAPTGMSGINEQTVSIQPTSVTAVAKDTIPKYWPW